jgi:hypothetical protein
VSDETETEAWLEGFQPRRPRPELRAEILAACSDPPPPRRLVPWLDLSIALCLLAAIAVFVLAEIDARRRLAAASGPPARPRAAREADALLRSIGLEREQAVRERAVAALSTTRVLRAGDRSLWR